MSEPPSNRRRRWPRWIVALAGTTTLVVAFLLGTLGWFGAAFGIGSNCTDQFSCASDSCAPCGAAHAWITAGGVGQWVMFVAAVTILVLGLRRSDQYRRPLTIAACTLVPLAVAWFAFTTAIAQRSF
jgi:hypothetical protein